MNIFKLGDTQKAICHACQSLEDAVFALRDVPFSDGSGTVKNVLVGVCSKCGEVILVPQQSAPAIKKQLDARKKPVETRVPAHMVDILNLASSTLGATTDFSPTLVKYYIHSLSADTASAQRLSDYLENDLAKGRAQKRISLKGRLVSDELQSIKSQSHLQSTTDVMKAVVLKINDDVLVHPKPQVIDRLKNVAAAFA